MLNYHLNRDDIKKWSIITTNQGAKELLFYASEVGHFRVGQDNFTERTDKKEYFLLYTLKGSGVLKRARQTIALDENYAVLVYCEEYQYYKPVSSEKWDYLWVHFNGVGAQSYYSLINDAAQDKVTRIFVSDKEQFVNNINGIMQYPDVPDIKQSVLSSMHISNLLSTMVMDKYSEKNIKALTQHRATMDKALAYIRQNYACKITLDELAGIAHLSKYYFLKLFRQFTGMTPYEYILNYRINQSKKMLRTTGMSVGQIADFCGFRDECNFIRKFKTVTGRTPLNFRKLESCVVDDGGFTLKKPGDQ